METLPQEMIDLLDLELRDNTAISLYKNYKVEKKLSNLEKDFQ